jgi:MOSC domain-containing protein YiiM
MNPKDLLNEVGWQLNKAKQYTHDHYAEKGFKKKSKSGTGMLGRNAVGMNTTGPVTPRMAGGLGIRQVVNTLIHTGLNKTVMPAVEEKLNNMARNMREREIIKSGAKIVRPAPTLH